MTNYYDFQITQGDLPVPDYCWSFYEGCVCNLMKNHEGLHDCDNEDRADSHPARTWTTDQADEWYNDLVSGWSVLRDSEPRKTT